VIERLLISTYNKIILWDGKAHTIWDERGKPEFHNFFGITWNDKEIYVAEGGREGGSLYHVFDEGLKYVSVLPFGLAGSGKRISDPHQIYWWDDKLYISSAKEDTIYSWDGSPEMEYIRWKKAEEPHQHLNSIWCDGEHFYVAEHRKRIMPKRVQVLDMNFSPLHKIIMPDDAFVKATPHGIHNIYIEDGCLYTCSPKAFVRFNMVTGETKTITSRLIRAAHYVRGLARVPGRWFIGLSEAKIRSERGEGDSAVLVLSDDLEKIDLLPLQDTGGLNDIRAIDGPDLAHNRMECPYG
jgi:hypothetical protein